MDELRINGKRKVSATSCSAKSVNRTNRIITLRDCDVIAEDRRSHASHLDPAQALVNWFIISCATSAMVKMPSVTSSRLQVSFS